MSQLTSDLPVRLPDLPPADSATLVGSTAFSAIEFLNGYALVFLAAFLITLLATPFVRRLAISMDIIDRPDEARKLHNRLMAHIFSTKYVFSDPGP